MKKRWLIALFVLVFATPALAIGDKDLAAKVAKRAGVDAAVAQKVIASFKDEVVAQLRAGEEVRLKGMGKFYVKHADAKTMRNPKTGKKVDVPARNYLRFKTFKSGHASVN